MIDIGSPHGADDRHRLGQGHGLFVDDQVGQVEAEQARPEHRAAGLAIRPFEFERAGRVARRGRLAIDEQVSAGEQTRRLILDLLLAESLKLHRDAHRDLLTIAGRVARPVPNTLRRALPPALNRRYN